MCEAYLFGVALAGGEGVYSPGDERLCLGEVNWVWVRLRQHCRNMKCSKSSPEQFFTFPDFTELEC